MLVGHNHCDGLVEVGVVGSMSKRSLTAPHSSTLMPPVQVAMTAKYGYEWSWRSDVGLGGPSASIGKGTSIP